MLAVMCCLALAVPAWAGFDEGVAAFDRGDYETAVRELRLLVKQGDAGAQYNLGAMYLNGWGVPQDDAAAVKWYRKAADQGHADAQFILGFMYGTGRGVPQDYVAAGRCYRKAAKLGDAATQMARDWLAKHGKAEPDNVSALRLFDEWLEQRQGALACQ